MSGFETFPNPRHERTSSRAVNLRLGAELHLRCKAMAAMTGESLSAFLRRAAAEHFERLSTRERDLADAIIRAWKDNP